MTVIQWTEEMWSDFTWVWLLGIAIWIIVLIDYATRIARRNYKSTYRRVPKSRRQVRHVIHPEVDKDTETVDTAASAKLPRVLRMLSVFQVDNRGRTDARPRKSTVTASRT